MTAEESNRRTKVEADLAAAIQSIPVGVPGGAVVINDPTARAMAQAALGVVPYIDLDRVRKEEWAKQGDLYRRLQDAEAELELNQADLELAKGETYNIATGEEAEEHLPAYQESAAVAHAAIMRICLRRLASHDLDGGREEVAAVGRRPPLEASSQAAVGSQPVPVVSVQPGQHPTNFERGDAA